MRQFLKFLFGIALVIVWSHSKACDTLHNAKCITYFSNGKIQSVSIYKDGKRDGIWKEYGLDNRIAKKVKYKRGIRIWEFKYQNNRVVETINRKGKVKKIRDCGC